MERAVLSDNRGFTLLETLVAMVILALVLLGLLPLVAQNIGTNKELALDNVAREVAASKLETFRSMPYTAVSASASAETVTVDNVSYSVSWTVDDKGSYKVVDVTVTWTYRDVTKQVQLTGIVGKT